jgi:DNA-directed RNA polymerase subunit L
MIRAFLSFANEDLNLVNLFRGQAKNESNDLEFADYSIKQPFDSKNADYIGSGIMDQIKRANMTICLYGPTTYTSQWVNWEIRKSKQLGKPVMGVSIYGDGRTKYYPVELEGCQIVGWNIADIVRTMKRIAR